MTSDTKLLLIGPPRTATPPGCHSSGSSRWFSIRRDRQLHNRSRQRVVGRPKCTSLRPATRDTSLEQMTAGPIIGEFRTSAPGFVKIRNSFVSRRAGVSS